MTFYVQIYPFRQFTLFPRMSKESVWIKLQPALEWNQWLRESECIKRLSRWALELKSIVCDSSASSGKIDSAAQIVWFKNRQYPWVSLLRLLGLLVVTVLVFSKKVSVAHTYTFIPVLPGRFSGLHGYSLVRYCYGYKLDPYRMLPLHLLHLSIPCKHKELCTRWKQCVWISLKYLVDGIATVRCNLFMHGKNVGRRFVATSPTIKQML